MKKRFNARFGRRAALLSLAGGLMAAAGAGVGLAEITTASSPGEASSQATTQTATTGTQTATTGDQGDENDQGEADERDSQGSSTPGQTSTTAPGATTTAPVTPTSGTTTTGEGEGNGQAKVTLCHKTGNPDHWVTISIAAPALPAHTAHGDTMGACAQSQTTTGTTTSNSTT